MDYNKFNEVITQTVSSTINQNQDTILDYLWSSVPWDEGWEASVRKASLNATSMAASLAVQTVIGLLVEMNILGVSENPDTPLYVIKGGKDPENS